MEKFINKLTNRTKEYLAQEDLYRKKLNTSEISIRQQLIFNKMCKGNFKFDDILRYLESESYIQCLDQTYSKRTLQRDLKII